jgi:hypothetical protein
MVHAPDNKKPQQKRISLGLVKRTSQKNAQRLLPQSWCGVAPHPAGAVEGASGVSETGHGFGWQEGLAAQGHSLCSGFKQEMDCGEALGV